MSPKNKAQGLLGMPLVIVRTIFEEVHHDDIEAFMNLSLLSKDCRRECERLLLRNLAVDDKSIIATKGDLHIFDRMQDPNDPVAEHVRNLRMGPFTDLDYYSQKIAPTFERALPYLSNLQSLDWDSPLQLPLNTLQDLYEFCPLAQLHVTNRYRRLIPLSRPLLSYPRLHTLDIAVYYGNRRTDRREEPKYNEFDILKNCLIHGGSVRVLRIGATNTPIGVGRGVGYNPGEEPDFNFEDMLAPTRPGPFSFPWENGDKFPPLEELKLYHRTYNVSPAECKMWTTCMDWTKLRKLDVEKGAPKYLFEALMGGVPQLKSLTFGAWSHIGYGINYRLKDWEFRDSCTLSDFLVLLSNFLGSITALEEISFTSHQYTDFREILPVIFKNAGCTMRVFHATCVGSHLGQWEEHDFMAVFDSCYTLTDFRLYLKYLTAEGHWPDMHVPARIKYETLIIKVKERPTGQNGDIRGM